MAKLEICGQRQINNPQEGDYPDDNETESAQSA
jgi:hypothetical protein